MAAEKVEGSNGIFIFHFTSKLELRSSMSSIILQIGCDPFSIDVLCCEVGQTACCISKPL
jgi:hypothetical protein